jgi:hypothetical protein
MAAAHLTGDGDVTVATREKATVTLTVHQAEHLQDVFAHNAAEQLAEITAGSGLDDIDRVMPAYRAYRAAADRLEELAGKAADVGTGTLAYSDSPIELRDAAYDMIGTYAEGWSDPRIRAALARTASVILDQLPEEVTGMSAASSAHTTVTRRTLQENEVEQR